MTIRRHIRAMTLTEVSISLVLLTLFIGGMFRLYAETMSRQYENRRSQEAENLSIALHQKEFPTLFQEPLGPKDLGKQVFEGREYTQTMLLEPVEGYDPQLLRKATYEVRYEIKGVQKSRTYTTLVDHRD